MKHNFVVDKWKNLQRWIRLQWNKPSSESAIWRESRAKAPAKPANKPKKTLRRDTRVS
jgi:hypothetical protein